MKKKAGFFGGTFDPIHIGHIHLALCLKEKCGLDEVWFSPAFLSPFKKKKPPLAPSKHRLEMVRLAIEKIPGFFCNEEEILEEKISYTIDALRKMQEKVPNTQWHLFLSGQELYRLAEWKEIAEIFRIAPPLVGGQKEECSKVLLSKVKGIRCVEIPKIEISSTKIRERLKKGLYCGHLLHEKVLEYIYCHKLYYSITK